MRLLVQRLYSDLIPRPRNWNVAFAYIIIHSAPQPCETRRDPYEPCQPMLRLLTRTSRQGRFPPCRLADSPRKRPRSSTIEPQCRLPTEISIPLQTLYRRRQSAGIRQRIVSSSRVPSHCASILERERAPPPHSQLATRNPHSHSHSSSQQAEPTRTLRTLPFDCSPGHARTLDACPAGSRLS